MSDKTDNTVNTRWQSLRDMQMEQAAWMGHGSFWSTPTDANTGNVTDKKEDDNDACDDGTLRVTPPTNLRCPYPSLRDERAAWMGGAAFWVPTEYDEDIQAKGESSDATTHDASEKMGDTGMTCDSAPDADMKADEDTTNDQTNNMTGNTADIPSPHNDTTSENITTGNKKAWEDGRTVYDEADAWDYGKKQNVAIVTMLVLCLVGIVTAVRTRGKIRRWLHL